MILSIQILPMHFWHIWMNGKIRRFYCNILKNSLSLWTPCNKISDSDLNGETTIICQGNISTLDFNATRIHYTYTLEWQSLNCKPLSLPWNCLFFKHSDVERDGIWNFYIADWATLQFSRFHSNSRTMDKLHFQ